MDDDQQFCLRWNNHQSTLISVFDTLLENETLVDCTLAAEGKILKAHKVVLSACSPYFAALLQEQYDKHPIFILKDVKYQELRAMMDYMYRGEVNISQDQLAALLKAAESLQIKGLSDNRNNSGIPKPDHHRGLSMPSVSGVGSKLGGYTLEQTKRARIGPSSMDSQDMPESREGSSSPSRRRRKVRRRSIENAMSDVHESSNSSQIQANQSSIHQQQSNTGLAAASTLASQIPVTASTIPSGSSTITATTIASSQGSTQQLNASVNKKTEIVKGSSDTINAENISTDSTAVDEQDIEHIKVDKQVQKQKNIGQESSELVIEPKSEYDEEGNDETVEDLTLDDEDMGIDDLDQNAGTSQGGEGSSQGYAWQHDRSQEELLLTPQEAQQRDPQDVKYGFQSSMTLGENMNDRFPCAVCGKSYLRKRHLQRHMRDECIGIPPRFSCELCPSRFRRKYHMVRHLTSKHGIPPVVAQQTTSVNNGSRSNTTNSISNSNNCINGVGKMVCHISCNDKVINSGSQNSCDSPVPENLSIKKNILKKKKEFYENENNLSSPSNACFDNDCVSGGQVVSVSPKHFPTYGLSGAITAISTATTVIENTSKNNELILESVGGTALENSENYEEAVANGVIIKTEPVTPNKARNTMEEDWKMKLSLQLISNSLLKERLLNSMPFAYNNN